MRSLLLVRVPKTGSHAIWDVLLRWSTQQLCSFNLTVAHTPTLLDRRPSAEELARFDRVVVTVRDPVARFVSAFNWRHPRNANLTTRTVGDPRAYRFEAELYGCFAHVSDLADALERTHRRPEASHTRCERLAWEACSPSPVSARESWVTMLQAGVASYVGRAGVSSFLARPLELAHTEDLVSDARRIYRWLGCRTPTTEVKLSQTHDDYPGRDDTRLSRMAELRLRLALHHEYAALHALEAGVGRSI